MSIPSPGTLFVGRYRIESVLGRGGMGIVLGATDEKTSVDCAVKLLSSPELGQDRARLVREARALMLISNPHVVRVFDVGEDDEGHPYLVLERLTGDDLGVVAPRGSRLAAADVIDYATQVCDALAAVHAEGIIHRDIKLSNLFLARGPGGARVLKVLDFGVSKVSGDGQGTLTNADGPLGSPQFISPEQLEDPRRVDARTDIWALGVVMYRLLSGELPFDGATVTETFALVASGRREPLAKVAPEAPASLVGVVERCLERDPGRRYASAAALRDALRLKEPFPEKRRWPILVAAFGATVAIGFAVTLRNHHPPVLPAPIVATAESVVVPSPPPAVSVTPEQPSAAPPPPKPRPKPKKVTPSELRDNPYR